MSLWSRLFKKKKQVPEEQQEWDSVVYIRDDVDFKDEAQRSRYIISCLEQIAEASREVRLLTGEYNQVTSSLMDLDEVEQLPAGEREELDKTAHRLVTLEKERTAFRERKSYMPDGEYQEMKSREDTVEEGITKIKEAEEYAALIKQDLQKLNAERHAYAYRREELYGMLANLKNLAVVFLTALAVCIVMLLILQFGFEMDTYLGYFLTVAAAAIALTTVCIKYLDADKERKRVENSINRLIQLQNKVKIRYVNNTNLLDFLCAKYHTTGADQLEKTWNRYQKEKEERKQYAEAEAKIEFYQHRMIQQLTNFHISDPYRFVSRPESILDKKEMVENRHDLIEKRQALRKQLEYNNNVADTARKEVLAIVDAYPAYAPEIMDMVDVYDKSEG